MINSFLLLLLLLLLLLSLIIMFIYIYCCYYLISITTAQGISISIYRCADSNDKNGFDVLLNCNFFEGKARQYRMLPLF